VPEWKQEIRQRLASVQLAPAREAEIVEELSQHLEDHYEELLTSGVTPEEAYRATLEQVREGGMLQRELRRVERQVTPEPIVQGTTRRNNLIADLWQDLRFGARMLMKQKAIAAIAVLSLGMGIGANTSLFSIMDAMLLKMLPVKEPERLVIFMAMASSEFNPGDYHGGGGIDAVTGQRSLTSFPYLSFQRMREQQSAQGALSDFFAFGGVSLNVNADGQADVAGGQAVSGNYYKGLGVQPLLGRTITDDDDKIAASPVAVLSYRYWRQRFSGDPAIIGRQINLNNVAFTVIGVTPPGFEGAMQVGSTQDVTIPIAWEPQMVAFRDRSLMYGAGAWWLKLMGRLKPGATAEQARAQLENAWRQSVAEHRMALQAQASGAKALEPTDYPRLVLDPGGQGEMDFRRGYAPSLYLLLGVVGMVLLIACANVANLLLARAASRQKEIGVRLALGASRWRLIRQLLTESVLLAALGGALGVLFALWIKNGLLAVNEWGGRGLRALEPQLDWRVLGFTAALTLLTGIVFGLAPAWRASKTGLMPALKESGHNSPASRSLLSRGLVVLQVSLSLLLLVGAGLFLRTLLNLQRVELGFDTHNLLLFDVEPGQIGYEKERLAQFYQQMSERLEAVAGVQAVTFSRERLLGGSSNSRLVYLPGAPPLSYEKIKESDLARLHQVRENFLEEMRIPLLAGRTITRRDDERSLKVAVVNQTFTNKFFPNENPVGKRFTFNSPKAGEIEIVGIARDAKYKRQRDEVPPTVYLPWRQELRAMTRATFAVRTASDPTASVNAIRRAAREIDANLPLNNIKTQIEQADEMLAMERLFAKLLTLFGVLAQQLAVIGLFGVMAYSVSQRTREIGIRMALGANRGDVLRMIVRQGMMLAWLGIVFGLTGAYLLAEYLEGWINLSRMLYGVRLSDPLTYGVIIVLMMLAALAACFIPARRATRVDPIVALRVE
jgi:predicted permease